MTRLIVFALVAIAAASAARADECEALAVGVSGVTFLPLGKRLGDIITFTAEAVAPFSRGRDDILLACDGNEITLDFAHRGEDGQRFPAPEAMLIFSNAVASVAGGDARTEVYPKVVACEKAAARDPAGMATVALANPADHLLCMVPSSFFFDIQYRRKLSPPW